MMERNPRYDRHYVLAGFGDAAQDKLGTARVLVVGAGGLGCPALQYLAAAGIGTLGIADGDSISLSNLQRQVLFGTPDIGKLKTEIAAQRLRSLNPEIEIAVFPHHIDTANALEILSQYDVILDCTDNFASRYLLGDASFLLNKPLVFGAIYRYEGQLAVFNSAGQNGIACSYRDLFPDPPKPSDVSDCNEAGVLGVLPGTIGTLMANEAIKLITGIGTSLSNRLMTLDLLNYDQYIVEITPKPGTESKRPRSASGFRQTDYEWLCGTAVGDIAEVTPEHVGNILRQPDTVFIDVRESHELPRAGFDHLSLPLSEIKNNIPETAFRNIIVFCQSGKRSLEAAHLLKRKFGDAKNISHIKGGMIAMEEHDYGKTD